MVRTLTLLLALCLAPPCQAATDAQRAEGIRQAEGSALSQVGRRGERGEWQIDRGTWRQHSGRPFWWASSPLPGHRAEARRVALAHVRWIRRQLPRLGLPDTDYCAALVWNAGWGHAMRREFTARNYDFARRAAALAALQPWE